MPLQARQHPHGRHAVGGELVERAAGAAPVSGRRRIGKVVERRVRRVADARLGSVAVYDALHVCCAERMSADRILTYNLGDFERCRPRGIVITAP